MDRDFIFENRIQFQISATPPDYCIGCDWIQLLLHVDTVIILIWYSIKYLDKMWLTTFNWIHSSQHFCAQRGKSVKSNTFALPHKYKAEGALLFFWNAMQWKCNTIHFVVCITFEWFALSMHFSLMRKSDQADKHSGIYVGQACNNYCYLWTF